MCVYELCTYMYIYVYIISTANGKCYNCGALPGRASPRFGRVWSLQRLVLVCARVHGFRARERSLVCFIISLSLYIYIYMYMYTYT